MHRPLAALPPLYPRWVISQGIGELSFAPGIRYTERVSADPAIRFLVDPAGQRVAYAVHGQGPPLVFAAWWVSHVEDDWAQPEYRQFFRELGRHYTVVRYDRPGAGLSDRDRSTFDVASEVATLEALIDHLELEQTALFGLSCAGPPSIRYAALHPERVSRLLLFGSYVHGRDVGDERVWKAMQELVRAHWGLGAKALADLFSPNLSAQERNALGKAQLKSASAEMSARLLDLTFNADARDDAQGIRCPTLVLHRKGDHTVPLAAGREAAATLRGATFQSLEGADHVPWFGDARRALDIIVEFLGATTPAPRTIPDRSLHRDGDVWTLRYAGMEAHLPHARGLQDLATLLTRPGTEIHAGALWSGNDGPSAASGSDPVLDERAMASYRARLNDLESELAEAQEAGSSDRAEALLAERDALARELQGALGLGGRQRKLGDVGERARKAVTARIRASLKKISAAHPALGEHLQATVKTGTYCLYAPGDGRAWQLTSAR